METKSTTILKAQLAALEQMYSCERRCDGARRILDQIHAKKSELSLAERNEQINKEQR